MFVALLLAALMCSVSALRVAPARSRSMSLNAKSKALPFLEAPAKLDGSVVGDFGFDPLGFTDTLSDLSYVRASEIKHGRVAMLAVVGFVFQQYFHIVSDESNPLKAIPALGLGPNLQVLFAIGCIELATWDKTFESTSSPGNFGFDGGYLKGKSQVQIDDLKLKEIKNGRLAMVAFIGQVVQMIANDFAPTL